MKLEFLDKNNKDTGVTTFIKGYTCGQLDACNAVPGSIQFVVEDKKIPYINIENEETKQYLKINIHDLEAEEENCILFRMIAESNVDSMKDEIESFNKEYEEIFINEEDEIASINKFVDKICSTINNIRENNFL